MAFVRKQVDTERGFGADLRELRELRGWSLEQVSAATGIPKSSIKALEEEDGEAFRDPVYAERHLRLIVKVLEGRVGFFLHKYQEWLERRGLTEKPNVTFFAKVRKSALFVPSRYFLLLLPLPLAFFLGWYVWHQADKLSAAPKLEIAYPADNAVLSEPVVLISGITDPSARVTVNGVSAVVESSGIFETTVNIPRGATKLTVLSQRRYGGKSEAVRYVTYSPEYAPAVLDAEAYATTTRSASSTDSGSDASSTRMKPEVD